MAPRPRRCARGTVRSALTARDMVKIGGLWLNGVCSTVGVFSTPATSPRSPPISPELDGKIRGYAHLWWVTPLGTHGSYSASGQQPCYGDRPAVANAVANVLPNADVVDLAAYNAKVKPPLIGRCRSRTPVRLSGLGPRLFGLSVASKTDLGPRSDVPEQLDPRISSGDDHSSSSRQLVCIRHRST
jgi:hypothetical protein